MSATVIPLLTYGKLYPRGDSPKREEEEEELAACPGVILVSERNFQFEKLTKVAIPKRVRRGP